MITRRFQFIIIFFCVCFFVVIFRLLRKKELLLKYTLVWLFMGVVLTVFAIFPNLVGKMANAIGIYLDVNFLFFMLIGLLMCVVISLTIIVSRMNLRNKRLTQALALMERRLRELEKESRKEIRDGKK
ncbi:DUF2304 domain-containing protein [Butyrivibrio sp. INlla18]|uniref:DUF2304 domain-containing protein n=1 Tax=Butyrivibrio sp. INlla18 TaxID=1520806 RepID=UPI00159FCBDC|nr:DUF2304 domain-containing protein [Butyrivibrio sp. INlla18]